MRSNKTKGVKVTLGGRSFMIACEDEKRDELEAAVSIVEKQLSEVQQKSKVIGLDRCALLVALNIASELLKEKQHSPNVDLAYQQIKRIKDKVDTAVEEQNQLSF